METCLSCGEGVLQLGVKPVTFEYKGHKIDIPEEGRHCTHCDDGVIAGRVAAETEKVLNEWKAQIDKTAH
jgi:YgiT-type zinc finger domain-containing protein